MKVVIALGLAASCLVSCASKQPATLDELIAFEDPSGCVGSPGLRTLLNDMARLDDGFTVLPGRLSVSADLAGGFGEIGVRREDGWSILSVPVSGSWHGLSLLEIRQRFPPGGDPPSNEFVFDASVTEVSQVAHDLGFPPSGSEVDSEQDVYSFYLSIEPEAARRGATVMSCAWG